MADKTETERPAPIDPPILFVKPKAISKEDKATLKAIGVFVIEVADPAAIKFTRAVAELSASEMLACALKAIATSSYGTNSISQFGKIVIEAFLAKTHQTVTRQ